MKIGNENETLEFKKTTGELKEGIISIVSILNKHNRGELYFGVRNDGIVLGQDVSDKTLRDISQAVSNHIEPQIFPAINSITIDDVICIHISFEGQNVPYYAYGRAYIRVADEDRVMSPTELESFIIKKSETNDKWDTAISDETIDDIGDEYLKEYLNRANDAGRVNYAYTNKQDILNKLNLIHGDNVLNVARIMFSRNPMLEIQMAIFATNERLTFNDIKRASGNVYELVDIAEKYIKNNINWRVEFDGSIQRKEIPEIPMDAVREALVNSFCHKDYKISQNNEVAIYKNRIEIYNPGTFPTGLTPYDFIEGSERSIKRNPLLAQLLYYSKDVESFGTGLKRIKNACDQANIKVEFQMLKTGFVVVFYRSEYENTDKNTDKSIKIPIKMRKEKIIEYLNEHAQITNKEVRELLGVTDSTAKKLLASMVDENLLVAVGEKKSRKYLIKA